MSDPLSLLFLPREEGEENMQGVGGQWSQGEAGGGAGWDGTDPFIRLAEGRRTRTQRLGVAALSGTGLPSAYILSSLRIL